MRLLILLAPAALAVAAIGCDNPSKCDATCGTGGSGTTTSTETSTSTQASTSTSTQSSTSTGMPQEWALPACSSVHGPVPLTFSADQGKTLAPFDAKIAKVQYFNGLAATTTPNTILGDFDGNLYLSNDAGCTFSLVHATSGDIMQLVRAGDGVYGWTQNGHTLYRWRPSDGYTALPDAPESVMGIAADPKDPTHVRLIGATGTTFDSTDAGATFAKKSAGLFQGEGSVYVAAIDPHDLNHVFLGVISEGGYVTKNGGAMWTKATGLGLPNGNGSANAFAAVISPVDPNTVWVHGIALGNPAAMPPVPDERHVYRSVNGGLAFTPVVNESADVTLTNGAPMLADPADASAIYFEFGTSYQGYGTDIFHYEDTNKKLDKTHNAYDDMNAFIASPADGTFLYFAVTSEKNSG